MKPVARAWLGKAMTDWVSAKKAFRARRNPDYAAVRFHARRSVERMLKAALAVIGRRIPQRAGPVKLAGLCLDRISALRGARQELALLNRRPRRPVFRPAARDSLKAMERVGVILIKALGRRR